MTIESSQEVFNQYGLSWIGLDIVRTSEGVEVLGRNQAVRMLLSGTLVDPFRYQQACWQRGSQNGGQQ